MMKSITQDFYDIVFQESQAIVGDDNVYQLLPLNADTPYPFVVVNNTSTSSDALTNSKLIQEVKVYVDIWGSESQRKMVDDTVNRLLNALIPHGLNINRSSYQITPDTSTDEIYWRASVVGVFNNGRA